MNVQHQVFDTLGICMQPGELANACTEYALLICHTKLTKINLLRLNLIDFVVFANNTQCCNTCLQLCMVMLFCVKTSSGGREE